MENLYSMCYGSPEHSPRIARCSPQSSTESSFNLNLRQMFASVINSFECWPQSSIHSDRLPNRWQPWSQPWIDATGSTEYSHTLARLSIACSIAYIGPLDSIGVTTPWYYHVIVSIGVTTPWLGAAATWYRRMMVV